MFSFTLEMHVPLLQQPQDPLGPKKGFYTQHCLAVHKQLEIWQEIMVEMM